MILAHRLLIPDGIQALLWDMDGVLLDTLTFDYELCNQLLRTRAGWDVQLARATIRHNFPYDLPEFWRRLVESTGRDIADRERQALLQDLVDAHERARRDAAFAPNEGIREILEAARQQGLRQAVVSNNPTDEVRAMVRRAGILGHFDHVIGNDLAGIAKKPAPDCFLLAAKTLHLDPQRCVVIEDSLLGAEAGRRAGAYTIAVATGAADFGTLAASPHVDDCYLAFTENRVQLRRGDVTQKRIATPNDFVSHMVEHIAWRMGCSLELAWNNANWFALGQCLGQAVAEFPRCRDRGAVLGMIDDGSAEVSLLSAETGELILRSTPQIDLDWFLALRCEQLSSGTPLVRLLQGLAQGCHAKTSVTICNLEDPHHTWEGVFRSVGIVLNQMHMPAAAIDWSALEGPAAEPRGRDWGWDVTRRSATMAEIVRQTAESRVRVLVDCSGYVPAMCRFVVSESIQVDGLQDLLDTFARAGGLRVEVDFEATRLSSSHVAMEDTGLVLGRALKEILVARMDRIGVDGAGSSLDAIDDIERAPIRVGVSVEGRKFWRFVPFGCDFPTLRREFLVGHTVAGGLFSEDLDDFIDGLAGGLAASVLVHIKEPVTPQDGWPLVFAALGKAVAGALLPNPARKGVPPGVKATLA